MNRYFPALQEQQLRLVTQLYRDDPAYFDDPKCPYPDDIKKLFQNKSVVPQSQYFEVAENAISQLPSDEQIIADINDTYYKLKQYWNEVKNSDKSTDKNTFFRVATTLLEKVVELREKTSRINQVEQFITEVLNIMGEILNADQRNEVMERLKKFQAGQ